MSDTATSTRRLGILHQSYPLGRTFAISRGAKTSAEVIEVRLSQGGHTGRGEAVPYARYGETIADSIALIEGIRADIERGMSRAELQDALPPGAARCAVDCAMWDLEARTSGTPVWQLAGLPEPRPVLSAETVVLASAAEMAEAARAAASTLLKLKLGGPEDLDRVRAVHEARPDAKLILDGNEGIAEADFDRIAAAAVDLGVVLIEQPFPVGRDASLRRRASPVAICADESVHTLRDIERIAHGYDAINVKLDKAGGLTAALELVHTARQVGLYVMVGCMVASSLSMAPAQLLAALADGADLDGPLWLAADVENGLRFEKGFIHPPSPALWG